MLRYSSMQVPATRAESPDITATSAQRLSTVLGATACVWLVLLLVGFFAPGGWSWGQAGPFGHIQNYMISLWLVTLVIAPVLAARAPLTRASAIQVYLLGVLGVVLSTFRAEQPKLIADVPPLLTAAVTIALVTWAHPRPSDLLSP